MPSCVVRIEYDQVVLRWELQADLYWSLKRSGLLDQDVERQPAVRESMRVVARHNQRCREGYGTLADWMAGRKLAPSLQSSFSRGKPIVADAKASAWFGEAVPC